MTWRETAKQAWAACDERKLTIDEKLAIVCEAIDRMETATFGRSATIPWLASLTCLTRRAFSSICARHMAQVNLLLEEADGKPRYYVYRGGAYHASGRGPFGRYRGGGVAWREPPSIVDVGRHS